LWKTLARFAVTLHSEAGQRWITKAATNHLIAVGMNLFADVQDITCPFVQMANIPDYRNALENGEPISPQASHLPKTTSSKFFRIMRSDSLQAASSGPLAFL
jgi:hypothetical protein